MDFYLIPTLFCNVGIYFRRFAAFGRAWCSCFTPTDAQARRLGVD